MQKYPNSLQLIIPSIRTYLEVFFLLGSKKMIAFVLLETNKAIKTI